VQHSRRIANLGESPECEALHGPKPGGSGHLPRSGRPSALPPRHGLLPRRFSIPTTSELKPPCRRAAHPGRSADVYEPRAFEPSRSSTPAAAPRRVVAGGTSDRDCGMGQITLFLPRAARTIRDPRPQEFGNASTFAEEGDRPLEQRRASDPGLRADQTEPRVRADRPRTSAFGRPEPPIPTFPARARHPAACPVRALGACSTRTTKSALRAGDLGDRPMQLVAAPAPAIRHGGNAAHPPMVAYRFLKPWRARVAK